jgi:UDP-N-acetyl-2-amino-2-deoxyglucuronate dehydrogenase
MIQKKMIRLGLLGCGRVAEHYKFIIDNYKLSNSIVTSVCDLKLNRAIEFGKHFSCNFYTDLNEMLKIESIDLLLILTPSGLHFEHAKKALEAGVNVIVEKPITMITDEAIALKNLANQKSKMYGCVFQNRMNPCIQKLKETIDQGRFGKIITRTVRLRWCRHQNYFDDGWHGTWKNDGGVINQQAIHHVDILKWTGGSIEDVCGIAAKRLNKLEAEDTFVAILKFKDGALGTIEATTAARPQDIEASLSIIGEKGYAEIGGIALNKVEKWHFLDPIPDDENIFRDFNQIIPNGYGLSHGPFLQCAINNLSLNNIQPPVDVNDSIETLKLIHSLYASVELKRWVSMSEGLTSSRLGR